MIGAGIIAPVVASHDSDASAGIGAWLPIACYLTLLMLITQYTTFKTPETLNRDLDEPCDAWEIASAGRAIPSPEPVDAHEQRDAATYQPTFSKNRL
jgi:MHS family metabolite:H+ symporter-like MFS transporter